jgi:hypothetical protein
MKIFHKLFYSRGVRILGGGGFVEGRNYGGEHQEAILDRQRRFEDRHKSLQLLVDQSV